MAITAHAGTVAATAIVAAHGHGAEAEQIKPVRQIVAGKGAETGEKTIVATG